MIDIKIFARKRAEGTGRGGSTTPWTQSDDVRHALSADKATFAEQADKALQANGAARAAYADKARTLAEDSPAYDEFLRKDKEDTAKELINFLKGIMVASRYSINELGEANIENYHEQGLQCVRAIWVWYHTA